MLTAEAHRFCASQLVPVQARSKSDPYKHYVVDLRPVGSAHPSCTCMAWIMARSRARKALNGSEVNADLPGKCKHLTAALADACTWEGEDAVCGGCGGPTAEVGANAPRPAPTPAPASPTPTVGMPELRPMLAEEINAGTLMTSVSDPTVWFEQKVDGHRVLIHIQGGVPTVLGRAGQASQHAARFGRPAYADITRLEDCVIDGELVGSMFWVFDLPHHYGEGIAVASPYANRRAALEKVFAAWAPDPRYYRLLPVARSAIEKGELAATLLRNRAEGVIIKEITGTYSPGGRTRAFLKAKFVKEADCVVTAIGEKGHDSYTLGLYRNGQPVRVGRCSAVDKVACEVDDVVVIRFLYLGANDRLFQPRLMYRRTDKTARECDWSQLANAKVNHTVFEIPDAVPAATT